MFYIFHGPDSHSQQTTVDGLKKKLGDPEMLSLNTTKLSGQGLSFNQLTDLCNAMPFLAPKRLIIVEDYFKSKPDKKSVDQLLAYLETMPDSARLIFLESVALPGNSRVLKAADKLENGYAKKFERLTGPKLEQWIVRTATEKGGRMGGHAAHMLASNAGNDLQLLANEIEKLVLYKGISPDPAAAAEITAKDIETLSPHIAEVNIFDLVDALGGRNAQRAGQLLHQKLDEGTEPFLIFSMIIRQFRLLIQAKELAELSRMGSAEIAKAIKIHPFVAQKVTQQARSFSLQQLEHIYHRLLDIDIRVKTGREDLVTALNLLLFSLA